MKKRLVWEDDVEEIDMGDGDFITISKAVTVKEMAVVSAAESRLETSMALLHTMIRAWRGPSFEKNGEPVPCTPENIDRLDYGVANELAGKLATSINGERIDDEERKESTESSSST